MQHLPIHPTLLHPLTGQPLQAIGLRPNGAPLWPIMGGDGSDDDANDKSDDSQATADDSDDDADDSEGDDKLKPEDDPESIEYWKKRSRQNEREARKYRREAESAAKKPAAKSDKDDKGDKGDAPDVEKIRADARAEAAREVLHSRVEDKIEAKARAFADPEDAVAVLLRSHDHDDFLDGDKIDVEAIADALTELGEKKPHLLAQGGKKFGGDADQGTRKETKARPKSLGDAISRAYQKR